MWNFKPDPKPSYWRRINAVKSHIYYYFKLAGNQCLEKFSINTESNPFSYVIEPINLEDHHVNLVSWAEEITQTIYEEALAKLKRPNVNSTKLEVKIS